jgi:hypothetical protein
MKAKRNKQFLKELTALDDSMEDKSNKIVEEANDILQNGHFIYNAKQVVDKVR